MHVPAQEVNAVRIAVVLIAIAIVASWRTAVKWLIAMALAALAAALGYGLIMIWQNTHHG